MLLLCCLPNVLRRPLFAGCLQKALEAVCVTLRCRNLLNERSTQRLRGSTRESPGEVLNAAGQQTMQGAWRACRHPFSVLNLAALTSWLQQLKGSCYSQEYSLYL